MAALRRWCDGDSGHFGAARATGAPKMGHCGQPALTNRKLAKKNGWGTSTVVFAIDHVRQPLLYDERNRA